MAGINSTDLHQSPSTPSHSTPLPASLQHEKKSCSLASLSSDYLLQLNGLVIQVSVTFPFSRVMTGRVLAVLIPSVSFSLPELLFLELGSDEPDFLASKYTFLICTIGP